MYNSGHFVGEALFRWPTPAKLDVSGRSVPSPEPARSDWTVAGARTYF